MKNLYYIIISLWSLGTFSQSASLKKANQKYENFNFIDASKIYLKVAKSGYESEDLLKKLGNLYYFKANYTEAEKWYEKLYTLNHTTLESDYLLRYSQTLKATGKEPEAEKIYNQFLSSSKLLNNEFSSSKDYLDIIEENGDRYNIEALSINYKGTDYGAFIKKETLYFASTRDLKKRNVIDAWNNEPFLDIYSVDYNSSENTFGKPLVLKGDVNTKFHESSPVVTKDGKTLYFTRTNTTPRIKKFKKGTGQLKIYRATKVGDEWTNIEDISINGDNYSNVHPVLSPDENTLYFASNMPSSLGETDIYSVSINKNGSFGKPKNLGSKINTKGRESFPFVTENNELYFSSDGHFGLGGYDVFYIDLNAAEKQLLNVGAPVNGATDDFAFSMNNNSKKGFFSSNRSGTDNIYSFQETKPIKELLEVTFKGSIVDSDTGNPLPNTTINVISEDTHVTYSISADENGWFSTSLNKFKSFTITITNKDYETTDIFLPKIKENYNKNFKLVRNVFDITENNETDLSKVLHINHIYFDLNKSTINKDAEVELEKVVAAMQQNPNLKIDVRAHTDNRATANYNMMLSNKRAKATIEYLIKRGINKIRLTGRGYGETELINTCTNCSEYEHLQNRRSEFIIIK